MDNFLTVEQVIAKQQSGLPLTPWEISVYRLNVRPDGSRYAEDPKERDKQYRADVKAEQAARKANLR